MGVIALVLTVLVPLQLALAEDRCPLINPAYNDIRAAADKLAKDIKLLGGATCADLEKQLKDTGVDIKRAVDGFYETQDLKKKTEASTPDTPPPAEDEKLAREKFNAAIGGVQTLSTIITQYSINGNKACTKALSTRIDFFQAVVDTVNGLSPYVLIYGGIGAAPLVLGANVLAGLTNSFLSFFTNRNIDMTNADNERAFTQNACAFLNFDRNYRALSNRNEQLTEAQSALATSTLALTTLQNQGAPKILEAQAIQIEKADREIKKDLAAYNATLAVIAKFRDPSAETCGYVRRLIKLGFPKYTLPHLKGLLETDKSNSNYDVSTDLSVVEDFEEKNRLDRFSVDEKDAKICATRSAEWIDLTKNLFDVANAALDRDKRREKTYAAIQKWDRDIKILQAAVDAEKSRIDWLQKLKDEGEANENSRIAGQHKEIRDALFRNKTRSANYILITLTARTESPAESWLKRKLFLADYSLQENRGTFAIVKKRWLDPIKWPESRDAFPNSGARGEACAQIEAASLAWNEAVNHISAAEEFCTAFRRSINAVFYAPVTDICFGKINDRTGEYGGGKNAEMRRAIFRYERDQFDMKHWANRAKCPSPERLKAPGTP